MAIKKSEMKIPKEVKEEVLAIVSQFNQENDMNFIMTFRGQYAYLSKKESSDINEMLAQFAKEMGLPAPLFSNSNQERETKLGRLQYHGKMDDWTFDVFKYSRETYDPNEYMFPGVENLDGTIRGALLAGMEVY